MNSPPAGRPRKNPKATRVTLAVRVDPETERRIKSEAKRTDTSAGEVIDKLARKLK